MFLTWPDSDTRLELMTRPDVTDPNTGHRLGYAHLAIAVGACADVDRLAAQLAAGGVTVTGQPRWTGDGYYEAVIHDDEGNSIELIADR